MAELESAALTGWLDPFLYAKQEVKNLPFKNVAVREDIRG